MIRGRSKPPGHEQADAQSLRPLATDLLLPRMGPSPVQAQLVRMPQLWIVAPLREQGNELLALERMFQKPSLDGVSNLGGAVPVALGDALDKEREETLTFGLELPEVIEPGDHFPGCLETRMEIVVGLGVLGDAAEIVVEEELAGSL